MINSSMSMKDQAHAYMINLDSLENFSARINLYIDALDRLMNYSTQTSGLLSSFDQFQFKHFRNDSNIKVITWYDSSSAPLLNAVDISGDLKDLATGSTAGDARPANITFAKIC